MASSAHSAQVLFVSHAACFGGAERSLLALIKALGQETGIQPFLACPETGELRVRALACGILCETLEPVHFGRLRRGGRMLTIPGAFIREVRGLGRILSKHGIDLVHANGARACVAALVAALRAHIPCVWHVRDYPKHVLVVRALLAGSALTLAPSAFIASALRDIRSRAASRIRVVANGVARPVVDSSAAKEIRRALLPSASAPLITMVAQIVPWKGHLLFLEAATLVAAHLPDARFALVGNDLWGLNGAYEEAVREQANTGILKGRVHLLGYREDIGTVLAASNIMVLPSHNEPFGRVVVEAWHSKCAVVVSNIGGPAGLVEDGVTGLHFHDGDAESLACAIRRLVSDPLLRNGMATAGAKRAEQYSESSHVQGVLAAYRELLA